MKTPTPQEIAHLPADEALFLGAATRHVRDYYERERLRRIDRQCRLAASRGR